MTDATYIEAEIKQNRGPTLRFRGRLLAVTEWTTKGHDIAHMKIELWETRGGALIPVTRSEFDDGRRSLVSATVVEPVKPGAPIANGDGTWRYGSEADGEAAMRFAVLSHFDWNDRARSMVRELGWKLVREVA